MSSLPKDSKVEHSALRRRKTLDASRKARSLAAEPSPKGLRNQIHFGRILVFAAMYSLAVPALFFVTWQGLLAFAIAHFLCGCLGVSVGFHRYFTHRSFETSKWLSRSTAILGTLAFHGGPISWSTVHRAHHRFSDSVGDPHSARLGFLWSYSGWLFFKRPNGFKFKDELARASDLTRDRFLLWTDANHLQINVVAMILGLGICYAFGRPDIWLWVFPTRIVFSWQCTYLVNSYCHSAKLVPNDQPIAPINSHWVAILTYGEGYHRNHHDTPWAARLSRRWYEADLGYALIWIAAKAGKAKLVTRSS